MNDSSFGRLIGALVSPGKTFESIARRPTWVVPLIVLVLLSAAAAYLANERMDAREMIERSMEERGQEVNEEQIEQIVAFTEKFGAVMTLGGVLVLGPLAYLVLALAFWGAFRFFGGSDFSFKQSFSTVLYSMSPWIVASLLSIPLILSRESIGFEEARKGFLASNLAAFAPEDASAALTALLGSVDFFSLWTLALLILGYRTVARVSKGAAISIILVLWLLYVGGKVAWAAAFG
ncbi:MAG TPA: Yip1 family protein [Thermoanaerobaculia bacterium]|nr:Yip1 family protein [Thermoanaerobaculia bacterium]